MKIVQRKDGVWLESGEDAELLHEGKVYKGKFRVKLTTEFPETKEQLYFIPDGQNN